MKMRKFSSVLVFVLTITICFSSAKGQFASVKVGVNGMTCSACTRSVETSIRKLVFVENVEMDLENKTGKVTVKKGHKVEVEKIALAVADAGFSVRFLTAEYTFSKLDLSHAELIENGYTFSFFKNKPDRKNCSLRFIGADFQTKKEFAKYKNEFPDINFKKELTYYVIPFEK